MKKPTKRQLLDALAKKRDGCVKIQKSRSTGQYVGLYRSREAGIETDPEFPWSTVCEDHGGVVCHRSRKDAESNLSHPEEWCPVCQGTEPEPD
jgi:hypothetical protein